VLANVTAATTRSCFLQALRDFMLLCVMLDFDQIKKL